ncbi:MAG: alpha/beta hydrolase [Armatimonadota bacterium]
MPGGAREETAPRRGSLARVARAGAVAFIAAYVLFTALLWYLQEQLIFPGASYRAAAPSLPVGVRRVSLPHTRGRSFSAYYAEPLTEAGEPHPQAESAPRLLYFYGNRMVAADALPTLQAFQRLGAAVLTPDYAGYGESPGRPSEQGCYAAAESAYAWLRAQPGGESADVYASGWSLGGAVAAELAVRHPVRGLALFSTFTSMEELAARQYPWLPTGILLRHRFRTERKLPRVHCPVLIGYGALDPVAPPWMGRRLAEVAGGEVRLLEVEGAGHNDFFEAGGDRVLAAMRELLRRGE